VSGLSSFHGCDGCLRRSLDAVVLLLAVVSSLGRPSLPAGCCKLGKAHGPDVGKQKLACRANSVSVQEICWGRGQSLTDVRFAARSGGTVRGLAMSGLCHVWTAPSWQGLSSRLQVGRCSHVFGLFVRFT